ncbi:Acg family FMN-binding oxidoreductase [Leptospira adleri]|uniref:Tat pathway signal protein n=1 Tax=Leptospira adleri TaxID=2023186 RepID=A0A2M9YKP6_9LEPT|nr:hypothetical protein [Leptospira adleri]PJZ52094.1 hypothetical protein CH380_16790 [Leptospira adleri]PJZ62956.1 hypothetical protein CH376_05570 [Leptospira adleri]
MERRRSAIHDRFSRKEFLSKAALLGAGMTLNSFLPGCGGADYGAEIDRIRTKSFPDLSDRNGKMLDLIRYATLAPSGHNSQPWKFSLKENTIRIFPDFNRRLPAVDPDDRELYISLGCALENLLIASEQAGYIPEVEYFPAREEKECIQVILKKGISKKNETLFRAIPLRQSTRNEYDGKSLSSFELNRLDEARKAKTIQRFVLTDKKRIEPLIEYVKEGDRIQISNPEYYKELKEWIRFNESEAIARGDGLATRCTGNPSVPRWIGEILMDAVVSGKSQGDSDEKLIRSSSGMVVFTSRKNDRESWIEVGRAFEQWTLLATSLNVKSAFMNQPAELPGLRSQLAEYLGIGKEFPQLLVRFGYSQPMPNSPRRPLDQVVL